MVDYTAKLRKVTAHDGVFNYSNYGFGLLGLIIAHHHGMTYEDSIRQTITNPLAMDSTLVHTTERAKKSMATGHHSFLRFGRLNIGRQSQYWDMHDAMAGCGGLRSSGEDLLKFLDGLLEQKLPFAALAQQPLYSINDSIKIGMAWFIHDDLLPKQRVIWHRGQTGGFHSYLGFVDHEHKGVFILSNLTTTNVQPLGEELLRQTCKVSGY
jgi:CubicO group peptidase (beta-lactamase class C family)